MTTDEHIATFVELVILDIAILQLWTLKEITFSGRVSDYKRVVWGIEKMLRCFGDKTNDND